MSIAPAGHAPRTIFFQSCALECHVAGAHDRLAEVVKTVRHMLFMVVLIGLGESGNILGGRCG